MAAPSLLRANKPSVKAANPGEALIVCTATASETAGPFPTHTPSSLVLTDIRGDRTGVLFTVQIAIMNRNANCAPYEGAIVDIWHCDKDGNYSEYGGTGMQPTNYTNYHFLRGRQTTDVNGLVNFTSIFPGWYSGRATHIHVHVYNAAGTSLLVTQIAFPEGTGSAVNTVNAATAYGYTKGMTGYTYNASDNVFSDGVSTEMSSITGSLAAGYALTHSINVNGPVLGVEQLQANQNVIGQNYPNPFSGRTVIPVSLAASANVQVTLFDLHGRRLGRPISQNLASGSHEIEIDRNQYGLSSGYYMYKVSVENADGVFEYNKKMIVE